MSAGWWMCHNYLRRISDFSTIKKIASGTKKISIVTIFFFVCDRPLKIGRVGKSVIICPTLVPNKYISCILKWKLKKSSKTRFRFHEIFFMREQIFHFPHCELAPLFVINHLTLMPIKQFWVPLKVKGSTVQKLQIFF